MAALLFRRIWIGDAAPTHAVDRHTHGRYCNQLMQTADTLRLLLMYVVLPLWLAAGFADYLCHRASRIAETSGWKESLLHLLQFAELAVPVLAALFLEINAADNPAVRGAALFRGARARPAAPAARRRAPQGRARLTPAFLCPPPLAGGRASPPVVRRAIDRPQ